MHGLSRVTSPLVHLLNLSTDGLLRILGARKSTEPLVTEVEVKLMIEQGTQVGVFEPTEQAMVGWRYSIDRQTNSA
jgi:putative hemolysin